MPWGFHTPGGRAGASGVGPGAGVEGGVGVGGFADILWHDRRKTDGPEWSAAVRAGKLVEACKRVNPPRRFKMRSHSPVIPPRPCQDGPSHAKSIPKRSKMCQKHPTITLMQFSQWSKIVRAALRSPQDAIRHHQNGCKTLPNPTVSQTFGFFK